jgi:putative hemolysin
MDGSILLILSKVLAIFILVLANGFFVAAEFALVAMRPSRVDRLVAQGHPRAKGLKRAVTHLDSYLAATQLGVTMSSLGLGWLGEPAIAAVIEPALEYILPEKWALAGANTLGIIIAFTIITALHIVLGELAPKSLALQRPERTAIYVILLLELYLKLFRPAVRVLNDLGNWVLKILGLGKGGSEELIHSPEELRLLVSASREAGMIAEVQEDLLERVFRMGDRRVGALMTPRLDVDWLDIEDPISKLQEQITTSAYSSFLVCQESIDRLLGFVSAKDFLAASLNKPLTKAELLKLLTPPFYIPEHLRALNALELFKTSGSYIAVVVDEYGGSEGVVTLNDLFEAIVGDIHTGNEPDEPQAIKGENESWLIDGMLSIESFKELLNLNHLAEGEGIEYQTLGGFVLRQLGHLPVVNESFNWNQFNFKITAMDGHRIDTVLLTPLPPEDSPLE